MNLSFGQIRTSQNPRGNTGLVFTFFLAQFVILYSILFIQVTLPHFSKFKIIVGMSLPCFR